MRYFKHLLAIVVLLLSFTACEKDNGLVPDSGIVVSLHELGLDVTSRATPSELGKPLAAQFVLDILDESKQRVVYHGPISENVIPVAPSTYTITASYGQNVQIAKDSPYYEGTVKGVTVASKEEKHVTIACKVANSLLSVKYANQKVFDDLYSYYQVIVQNGNMSIGLDNPGNSAYFVSGSKISVYFEGILKGSEQKVRHELQHDILLTPLTAGQHLILTLKAANVAADIAKVEVVTETIAATIPMEWLPKPKMQATGFVNNELSFVETESVDANIAFNTALALQDLKIVFNFEDPQFSALNGKEFLLSNAEDKQTIEKTLNIILPAVGDEQASVNFKNLVEKLQTKAGVPTSNSITLDVKANNRWSSEDASAKRTYVLKCGKPEFNVSVSNGTIWTKEFTINPFQITKGNQEKLSSGMVYQISENKEQWNDVPASELLRQGLTPGKTYFVRSLYRGVIASNIVEVTTYPEIVLPNGDMEQWHLTKTKEGSFFRKETVPRYYPYASGDSKAWWATNMERAVIWSVSPIQATTCPNVSYVSDVHSGSKAAEIRTSGHGGGYGTTDAGGASIIYEQSAFAGRLFLGSYAWQNKSEVQTLGHDYVSRPTALSFWYKYRPFKNDAFKVTVLLQNNGTTIASGTFIPAAYSTEDTAYKHCKLQLEYDPANVEFKPTTLYVEFASTSATVFKKNEQFQVSTSCNLQDFGTKSCHIGSALKIDDISLVYDK